MDILAGFWTGLSIAFEPTNILFLFVGVFVGNLVGVLPGLGPVTGVALLIPFTFGMEPATALIMLSGIFYGAQYGGSTSAILLNIPGGPAAVMTAMEGYSLAKQGRAGPALAMTAIASFIAGTLGAVGLLFLTPVLAGVALQFGSPEQFMLLLAAFTLVATLSGSMVKGLTMAALGVVLATIGPEPIVAQSRLTFGQPMLQGGIDFVAASIGLFALPSVLEGVERPAKVMFHKVSLRIRDLLPTRQDFRESAVALPLGSVLGFFASIMPGVGPTESALMAYGIQKRVSRIKEKFGKGSMEALAAVEAANNGSAAGSMIPMLSFGIPASATTAVLMGAMMIHGLTPGPMLMQTDANVVYAVIASMYLGNVVLLILNLPLIGMWASVLRLPKAVILAAMLVLSVTGIYAYANEIGPLIIMFCFGVLGYLLSKLDLPSAPIILALILTGPLEAQLGRSLAMSGGDWSIFVTRPIAVAFLCVAVASIMLQLPILKWITGRRPAER